MRIERKKEMRRDLRKLRKGERKNHKEKEKSIKNYVREGEEKKMSDLRETEGVRNESEVW